LTIIAYFLLGFEIAMAIILLFLMIVFGILYLPKMNKDKSTSEISKELPYALRQMVTELRSGKGLHDTISSIASSDYGALSFEFSRVIEEIKYGGNTEKALLNMSNRVSSDGLTRAVQQIVGTLRTGGNLASTLNIIAEDISFDLQIKLKEYSQKLNAFIMIYTFLAILGPVILLIMLMAASTVMGDIVPGDVVLIMYIFFFPMIVVFMGLMIKRLEPSL
jgi:flagellar protein FlaJ